MTKIFYDKELSVSEQKVTVSRILHNHSLIMGKQIINILPEGSVPKSEIILPGEKKKLTSV